MAQTRFSITNTRYSKRKSKRTVNKHQAVNPKVKQKSPTPKKQAKVPKKQAKVVKEEAAEEVEIDFDLADYLHHLQKMESTVARTRDNSTALESIDVTRAHHNHQNRMEKSFIKGQAAVVTNDGKQKWAYMLEEVPNPNYVPGNGTETVPRAFVSVSGHVSQPKLMLANAMVIDWQVNLKKVMVGPNDKFPYYQPSSQATELRTFFAHMKEIHDWNFSENDLLGFKGCLNGVISKLFQQRLKKYVSIFFYSFDCIFYLY